MYTLRRISGNGVEMNKEIGDGYTVTREENTDEFNRFMESYGDKLNTKGFIYCFVTGDDGKYVQPLYKNQQAYIVSENGKTVSNLTHVDLKHDCSYVCIKDGTEQDGLWPALYSPEDLREWYNNFKPN